MWNSKTKEAFYACIADLIDAPAVQAMEDINQHVGGVSCLDHCIFVSYLSFVLCRRFGLDEKAAARAGLLHDLYLCDWKTTNVGRWERLLIHPKMALENAEQFGLSALERDIILNHMWPVTLRQVPRRRESALVNLADKLCATAEFIGFYSISQASDRLLEFNRRKQLQRRLIPNYIR